MLAAVTGRVDVEGVRRLMGVAGTADLPTRLPRVARSSQTSDSIPVLDVFQGQRQPGRKVVRPWPECLTRSEGLGYAGLGVVVLGS